jgi:hypothetical protein
MFENVEHRDAVERLGRGGRVEKFPDVGNDDPFGEVRRYEFENFRVLFDPEKSGDPASAEIGEEKSSAATDFEHRHRRHAIGGFPELVIKISHVFRAHVGTNVGPVRVVDLIEIFGRFERPHGTESYAILP